MKLYSANGLNEFLGSNSVTSNFMVFGDKKKVADFFCVITDNFIYYSEKEEEDSKIYSLQNGYKELVFGSDFDNIIEGKKDFFNYHSELKTGVIHIVVDKTFKSPRSSDFHMGILPKNSVYEMGYEKSMKKPMNDMPFIKFGYDIEKNTIYIQKEHEEIFKHCHFIKCLYNSSDTIVEYIKSEDENSNSVDSIDSAFEKILNEIDFMDFENPTKVFQTICNIKDSLNDDLKDRIKEHYSDLLNSEAKEENKSKLEAIKYLVS